MMPRYPGAGAVQNQGQEAWQYSAVVPRNVPELDTAVVRGENRVKSSVMGQSTTLTEIILNSNTDNLRTNARYLS